MESSSLFFFTGRSWRIVTDPGRSYWLIAVTCLCAYLIIYNIMHLSVAGKVRYYGLLQTIGMTETQIKRMMKEQMLLLGLAGTGNRMSAGSAGILFPDPCSDKISGDQKQLCRFCYDLLSSGYFDRNGSACRNYDFPCSQKTCKMAANISPMEALGYRAAGKGGKAGRKGK